jgi:chemotaxis protein methyltransferase CheR
MSTDSGTTSLSMSEKDFDSIRALVYDRFGINLSDQKRNLVVGRLQKVLRRQGFSNYGQYLEHLENDTTGESLSELIDRISTNHTFFFREPEHFRFMSETLLPSLCLELESRRERDIRIWSAGCSSGEEPYSIAITLQEYFKGDYARWQAGVLATDISSHVLRHAQRAIYPTERLAKTDPVLIKRYFQDLGNGTVRLHDAVQRDVTFRRLNFMSPAFSFKKPFNLISCRNVMIYFDAVTRDALTRKFYRVLVPGGYLFIGHSETLGRDNSLFDYVQPAIYRRRE